MIVFFDLLRWKYLNYNHLLDLNYNFNKCKKEIYAVHFLFNKIHISIPDRREIKKTTIIHSVHSDPKDASSHKKIDEMFAINLNYLSVRTERSVK